MSVWHKKSELKQISSLFSILVILKLSLSVRRIVLLFFALKGHLYMVLFHKTSKKKKYHIYNILKTRYNLIVVELRMRENEVREGYFYDERCR